MLSNLVNAIILKDNDNIYIKTITGPYIIFLLWQFGNSLKDTSTIYMIKEAVLNSH